MNFIHELLLKGWIGDNLRQALADGYFASVEDFGYFVEYVFAPLFCYWFCLSLIILFFIVWLFRFGFLLIDIFSKPMLDIYRRLRHGKVIHLYSPDK